MASTFPIRAAVLFFTVAIALSCCQKRTAPPIPPAGQPATGAQRPASQPGSEDQPARDRQDAPTEAGSTPSTAPQGLSSDVPAPPAGEEGPQAEAPAEQLAVEEQAQIAETRTGEPGIEGGAPAPPPEALALAPPAGAPQPEAAPQNQTFRVIISTEPSDSRIFVNGQYAGTGTYDRMLARGTTLAVRVSRPDYSIQEANLRVAGEISRTFSLRRVFVARFKVSSTKLVGEIAATGSTILVADGFGAVTAVDAGGARLWTISTGNTPNDQSFPVVAGGLLYFSGASDLVIADAATGELRAQRPLEEGNKHLFGQHVAVGNGSCIFPTEAGFLVLQPATGALVKEISVPNGSRMSPALYDGQVLLVDQKGTLRSLDPATGAERFSVATSAIQPVSTAVQVRGGRGYFVDRRGLVTCVDLERRAVRWERLLDATRAVTLRADIALNETGLYASGAGMLYGLSQQTGSRLFEPVADIATAPLATKGTVIAGTRSKTIAIIDASDGSLINTVGIEETPTTRPAALGTDILVGTETGVLAVLRM